MIAALTEPLKQQGAPTTHREAAEEPEEKKKMGRCKRRGLDAIITKRGQCSTNWRKDTPVKSDGKRGKLKRLLSKPLYTRRKGLVLSPINESACTDPRNMPTAATQRNRMLESKDDEDAPDSSTDDSSKGIFSQLLDETDSGDTSTSSLPSPEVFRREDVHEEMVDLPSELLDLRVKNSTLLDVSHAENINMQQTPNLSSIVEISQMTHAVDKETSQLALPLKWTSSDELFSAYVSAEKTPVSERATVPSVPMKNRPVTVRSRKIKCKKKTKRKERLFL
ncbi:hypothetical protein DPEC_G00226190 [Dallia pectoralis]|uniref:Uncharacterized protein n=1 Tax=Dallia pectoralis TaxID=75939 RepID=A0ACC2G0W8_DALPE|nr:hypothetical protein DPEC_G00226190 [Dallia pectoralis]